jgi:hypothetical protein
MNIASGIRDAMPDESQLRLMLAYFLVSPCKKMRRTDPAVLLFSDFPTGIQKIRQ